MSKTETQVGVGTLHQLVRHSGCGGMAHIREAYGVPAKRGGRVFWKYCRKFGTITHARYGRVFVRFDGNKRSQRLHPTWELDYLPNAPLQRHPGAGE